MLARLPLGIYHIAIVEVGGSVLRYSTRALSLRGIHQLRKNNIYSTVLQIQKIQKRKKSLLLSALLRQICPKQRLFFPNLHLICFNCTDFFLFWDSSVVHFVTLTRKRMKNSKIGETHSTSFAWVGSLKESIPRFHAPFPPPSEQHRREEERRRRNARRTH